MEKETRLKLAIILSLVFMVIEIVGGYLANSIAIFSDAAHLLTDIAGFGIALIATIAAKAPGTKTMTFGMARAEVFGALGSVLSLWLITAVLLYAAFFRAVAWFEGHPEPVEGFLMFVVAIFGILVNLCLGYVFHEDHGGAFHPAHSHDHGHAAHGSHEHGHHGESNSSYHQAGQIELPATSSCTPPPKRPGAHDHSHEHNSGKDHGHSHSHNHNETTPLLTNSGSKGSSTKSSEEPFAFLKAAKCSGHEHEGSSLASSNSGTPRSHNHDHAHASHSHAEHDHSDRDLEAARSNHGHDHSHGHGHQDSYGATRARAGSHAFEHDHHHASDVNLEAAYLHVLTDLIQSIGVAIAGAVLWWQPSWQIIDPVCTLIFSIVALHSTIPLINRVGLILFEGTPSHVDWEIVMAQFRALPGVQDVHDLHIWSISSDSISLTCHIRASNPQQTLLSAHGICRKLGIDHATIQVHDANDPRYCYSETCDDDALPLSAASSGKKKKKACV